MRQYGASITHFGLDNPDIWWYEGASWYPGRCRLPTISGLTQPRQTARPRQACLASMIERRIERVLVKRASSVSASPQRIARCKAVRSSVKRCTISSTASRDRKSTCLNSSHMSISYAVFCLKKKKKKKEHKQE